MIGLQTKTGRNAAGVNIKVGARSDRTEISAKSRGYLHFLGRVLGTFARSKVPLIGNTALQAPKKSALKW